ncbi:MAG: carbohydrate ABC transporter permease [bacterium]|nr:carbohydrate ABC transporter permease [bacterium]
MERKMSFMNRIKRINFSMVLTYFILIVIALTILFPFFWMVSTSLKTPVEAVKFPPDIFPKNPQLNNYVTAWKKVNFTRYFINTIFIALTQLVGVLFTSILAAYAFARLDFKGREILFISLLGLMMIPMPVYIVPGYMLLQKIGWIDTYFAQIVPWMANIFPIFLLRQHFKTIPKDLYDAAVIDGYSDIGFLFKVVVPLSKPALTTISIFSILASWNSFIWPLVVTNSDSIRPVQVGLAYFIQEQSTSYTLLMAASTFVVLPLVIMFFLAQKQIIESYARSGLKD